MSEQEFLQELFEYELCHECGGDSGDHIASPDIFGNWHAWCVRSAA